MAVGRTDKQGEFTLGGQAANNGLFDDIDPVLKLYHRCDIPLLQVVLACNIFDSYSSYATH